MSSFWYAEKGACDVSTPEIEGGSGGAPITNEIAKQKESKQLLQEYT